MTSLRSAFCVSSLYRIHPPASSEHRPSGQTATGRFKQSPFRPDTDRLVSFFGSPSRQSGDPATALSPRRPNTSLYFALRDCKRRTVSKACSYLLFYSRPSHLEVPACAHPAKKTPCRRFTGFNRGISMTVTDNTQVLLFLPKRPLSFSWLSPCREFHPIRSPWQ
jgi:hypothetical protein